MSDLEIVRDWLSRDTRCEGRCTERNPCGTCAQRRKVLAALSSLEAQQTPPVECKKCAELLEALRDAGEELRLLRMKDTAVVYNPTLRSRIAYLLAQHTKEPTR